MSTDDGADAPDGAGAEPRGVSASPSAAVLLGAVLLFAGLWAVTGGGPLGTGWALFAAGLALLLVGAVAWGVAWGLELHADSRH